MGKLDEVLDMLKVNELIGRKEEKKDTGNTILWILAIIGAVAAVAGIAYAVYRYLTPDYLEDFDDDFDDEFDDEFFEEEEGTPAEKDSIKEENSQTEEKAEEE